MSSKCQEQNLEDSRHRIYTINHRLRETVWMTCKQCTHSVGASFISGWEKKIRVSVARAQRLPRIIVWGVGLGSGTGKYIKIQICLGKPWSRRDMCSVSLNIGWWDYKRFREDLCLVLLEGQNNKGWEEYLWHFGLVDSLKVLFS